MEIFPSLDQLQDPYPFYAQMRREHPVAQDADRGLWALYRYDDVRWLTTDHQAFSSDFTRGTAAQAPTARRSPSLITTDPPRHDQLRAVVNKDFFPRAVARLTPRITEIADALLDDVIDRGRIDLVQDFSYPLPVTVIAELLGVPASDRPLFRRWADELLNSAGAQLVQQRQPAPTDAQQRVLDEMNAYFREIIAVRREHPQEDLISRLTVAAPDGEHLSEDELLGFCALLLLAGHVTTTNLIANAVVTLLRYPQAMDRLRHEPALIPSAIEEVLRYDSPVQALGRITAKDVEVGGVKIPAGQLVFGWIGSANRDEARFPDAERFDLARNPAHHLAFGFGIHYCLGAPLARLETQIALTALLERLDALARIDEEPLAMNQSVLLRGPTHLPLRFRPGRQVAVHVGQRA